MPKTQGQQKVSSAFAYMCSSQNLCYPFDPLTDPKTCRERSSEVSARLLSNAGCLGSNINVSSFRLGSPLYSIQYRRSSDFRMNIYEIGVSSSKISRFN